MRLFVNRSLGRQNLLGNVIVVGFMVVQCLDGVFTYLGVRIWGPGIEANPIVSAAMTGGGLLVGLGGAKLVAIGFGMLLHLRGVHSLIALLTAIYFTVAIVPWTALFLTH